MKFKKIHFLDSTSSTNQTLYHMMEQNMSHPLVIWTSNQTQGKGYLDNMWQSEVDKNILLSFSLVDSFDINHDLPFLNMWVAVMLKEFLSKWQFPVYVKWPNDIVFAKKKIAGILIENKVFHQQTKFTVVGIGLNVNQEKFPGLNRATSLKKELKIDFDLSQLVAEFVKYLEKNYLLIAERKFDEILTRYNQYLFKKDQVSVFRIKDQLHNGIIRNVNKNGELIVENIHKELQTFRHKEIELMY